MNLALRLMYFVYRKLELHRFDVENIRRSWEIFFFCDFGSEVCGRTDEY